MRRYYFWANINNFERFNLVNVERIQEANAQVLASTHDDSNANNGNDIDEDKEAADGTRAEVRAAHRSTY